MKLTTIGSIAFFGMQAEAYCQYRIRSYDNPACTGAASNDHTLFSRDCFNTNRKGYICIDSIDNTDYCKSGNWVREYANRLHQGSCSNNNRGQTNVSVEKCIELPHYFTNFIETDSIRINYA